MYLKITLKRPLTMLSDIAKIVYLIARNIFLPIRRIFKNYPGRTTNIHLQYIFLFPLSITMHMVMFKNIGKIFILTNDQLCPSSVAYQLFTFQIHSIARVPLQDYQTRFF